MSPRAMIFISYCRKDRRWLERLQVHLKPYDQRGLIRTWDDKKIRPGDEWRQEIQTAIDDAAAFVLLLSADFLASDFIVNDELPPALRKAETRGTKVFPLFVGPVNLATYPELTRYHAFNVPEKPLNGLRKPQADKILAQVAADIDEVMNGCSAGNTGARVAASTKLFQHLQSAAIGMSILTMLARATRNGDGYNLTEITRALNISPRRLAHAAVEELSNAGWVEKCRSATRTSYRILGEGILQLEHLSTIAGSAAKFADSDTSRTVEPNVQSEASQLAIR